MSKLKKITYKIASSRNMQCFGAVQLTVWYGATVAIMSVILAEMVYIMAGDIITTRKHARKATNNQDR